MSIRCLGRFQFSYFEGRPLYSVDCLTDSTSTTTSTTVQRCAGSCLWTYNVLTHTFDAPCQSCSTGCKCVAPTCPQTLLPGLALDCYQIRTQCIRTTTNPVIPSCTTTTTSSTTSTTTTTVVGCTGGCTWKNVPGIGFTQLTNFCSASCPCPTPTLEVELSTIPPIILIGGLLDNQLCTEITTQCSPLPPPPPCSGACSYVWSGTSWLLKSSSCTAGIGGCNCQTPSIPGTDDDCGIAVEVPCNPTEASTTTTFGYGCSGKCVMQWDTTDSYWRVVTATCGSTCSCSYPPYDGDTDCEYVSTLCITPTTKRCTGYCTWSYDSGTGVFSSVSTCSTGCTCLPPSRCPTDLEDCYDIRTMCVASHVPFDPPLCKTTTTSTTSTTTTTTLPENCLGGCDWLIVPGTTAVQVTNTCSASCPCADPPTSVATGPCYNVSTGCVVPGSPPPPPPCTGECGWKYVSEDIGWLRISYGCQGGTTGCFCDYPSFDAECNDETTTPCHPPDNPPTTTSTTPYGCLGECTLQWDLDSSSWFFVTKNCLPSCTCGTPIYDGVEDCEYTYVDCQDGTTSSTSSTTTTTGYINCYYCGVAPYFDNFCSTTELPSQCTDAIVVSGPYFTFEQCEEFCNTTTTTTSSTTSTTTTTFAYYCITTTGCDPACDSPCPVSGSKFCVFSTWVDLFVGTSFCAPGYTFDFTIAGPYTSFPDCETNCSTTSTTTTTTALAYYCYECGPSQYDYGLGCYPNGAIAPSECIWFFANSGPYPTYDDCYDVCAFFYDCDGSDCISVDAPLGTRDTCPPECPTTTTTTTTSTSSTTTTTTTTPHYYCITVSDCSAFPTFGNCGPCPDIGTVGCIDGNTAGFGGGTIGCGGGYTYDFTINDGPLSSIDCDSTCSATSTTTTTTGGYWCISSDSYATACTDGPTCVDAQVNYVLLYGPSTGVNCDSGPYPTAGDCPCP